MTHTVDNILVEKNVTHSSYSPMLTSTVTTSMGVYVLTKSSTYLQEITGTATNFTVQLPDATTLTVGWRFEVFNRSAVPFTIDYNDATNVFQAASDSVVTITLENNSTSNGTWIFIASNLADIDMSNPNFEGLKDGFEDFMFDAYSGSGSNDNQYAFTAVANSGTSDIDGAVTVAGNDYEGIHTLSSSTSATSRPLVHAFNGVNRIKLGLQPEAFSLRVRIETLSSALQTFTCRYGLMDIVTIGMPTNGVFFSYAPVTQVVTATPNNVTAGVKHYIQTVNEHTYDFTSDSTPTATEVVTGLKALMAADPYVTVSGTTTLIMTAKVIGEEFTYSGGTYLTEVLTTPNTSNHWIASVVNSSSATPLVTSVPVVANQWYRIKLVCVGADKTYVYIDDVFMGLITTALPTAGLHFVFKLEKTVGTTARTTSIDYIIWRRTRG